MADLKIEDADRDTQVTGVELFPASDGGAAKAVSAEKLGDYVIGRIQAATAADAIALADDKVYILKGGVVKPLPASVLTAAILDYAFGLTPVAEPNGNEIIPVKDSGTKKTITFTGLKTWLEDNLDIDADIDISALNSADALADSQLVAVDQSGTAKKATVSALKAHILSGLYAYATATTAAAANDDYIFIYANGSIKKVKVSDSGIGRGDVTGPATTTADTVPRWDTTTKKLKDGIAIVNAIAASPTGTKLASEAAVAAVRDAINNVVSSLSTAVSSALVATLATEINTTTTATDGYVPSAKAAKTFVEGYVPSAINSWASTALASGGALTNAISTAVSSAVSSSVTSAVSAAVGPAVASALAAALGEEGSITEAIAAAVATHGALEVGTTSGTTHPGETEE